MQSHPTHSPQKIDPDDFRQYLAFIQGIISRMSSMSSSIKICCVTMFAGIAAFASNANSCPVRLLLLLVIAVCLYLDCRYLLQERMYKKFYAEIIESWHKGELEADALFRLTLSEDWKNKHKQENSNNYPLKSYSISCFYGILFLLAIVIIVFA